jgi:hypothetical protein
MFPGLTWNERRADIPFPLGQCVVTLEENALSIALTVPDEKQASRSANVVGFVHGVQSALLSGREGVGAWHSALCSFNNLTWCRRGRVDWGILLPDRSSRPNSIPVPA